MGNYLELSLLVLILLHYPWWALEGQAAYVQKTFRKTGKLRTCSKIIPPHLKFSNISSLILRALPEASGLFTFSSMEKVKAMRLEQIKA
ncbi:hypothetical protein [Marinifilum sp. D737]|uniref:hypothetical protein n=1 Tax=Marinifilum sp. D737 TaxID=2969628 RepID=UPI0022767072|nr:hypothetical protein [Marinifilum sp. D737]MCY1633652.1 hypothetical protein [Marinifilum sp. D737]